MAENEIITREDPQMQLFSQLMEGTFEEVGAVLLYRPSDAEW